MCSDPDDPETSAGITPGFAVFLKKIDTAFRPLHSTGTFGQFSRPTDFLGQHIENFIEANQIVESIIYKRHDPPPFAAGMLSVRSMIKSWSRPCRSTSSRPETATR